MNLRKTLEKSEDVRNRIRKAVEVTKKTGYETGFDLCRPTKLIEEAPEEMKGAYKDILAENVVVGAGKHYTKGVDMCGSSENLGSVHTHPSRIVEFSSRDREAHRMSGDKISCVAGTSGDAKCIVNDEEFGFKV